MEDSIQILVTFDQNYIGPFQTMVTSLVINNPTEKFHVWLLHSSILESCLDEIKEYCAKRNVEFSAIQMERERFLNAPISKRYPQEMYYRLLAPIVLPKELDRILYLDPDLLVINSILPLWTMNLEGHTFAAASHTGFTDVINGVNRVRLKTNHDYYNSGVMLMDLKKARKLVNAEEIFACVKEHKSELLLPDQDVFNYLYGKHTKAVEDTIWNYDTRYFSDYMIKSNGEATMEWVMNHTVILHFCGKNKPWKATYSRRFTTLYKHYMSLSKRYRCI